MHEPPPLTFASGSITLLLSIPEVMDINSHLPQVRARPLPVPPTLGLISRLELIQEVPYVIQLVYVEHMVSGLL